MNVITKPWDGNKAHFSPIMETGALQVVSEPYLAVGRNPKVGKHFESKIRLKNTSAPQPTPFQKCFGPPLVPSGRHQSQSSFYQKETAPPTQARK